MAAFAVYELALYSVAVSILGETRAFAPRVIGHVLLVNMVTRVILFGLNQLSIATGFLSNCHRRLPAPSTPFA